MVFYFTADAKDPRDGEDYVVYMGADKYENEGLIEWGWKSDVWFHVDGLSSAHVYLRLPLKNAQCACKQRCACLLERIPEGVVEDMCQLVKANSIEGCKKGSVMVVYTPWTNLHKDETKMQAGAVGFHNSAHRVLRRVDKDRQAVKRIEKTRREGHPDLQQERLAYEREVVAWRKAQDKMSRAEQAEAEERAMDELRKTRDARDSFLSGMAMGGGGGAPPPPQAARAKAPSDVVVGDALMDARRDLLFPEKAAAARQKAIGDAASGVDAALDQLGLGGGTTRTFDGPAVAAEGEAEDDDDEEERPRWDVEAEKRYGEPDKERRWLASRGYGDVDLKPGSTRSAAILALVTAQRAESGAPPDDDEDRGAAAASSAAAEERSEEREALESIYADGELKDADASRPSDVSIDVVAYEAPDAGAPPLLMDVFVDAVAPSYPCGGVPGVAFSGGGLSEAALRQLATTVSKYAADNVGNGQLVFELVTTAGDEAQNAADAAEKDRLKRKEDARKAKRAAMLGINKTPTTLPPKPPADDAAAQRKLAAARARKAQDAQARLGAFGGPAPIPGRPATKTRQTHDAANFDDDDYLYGDDDSDSGDDFGVVKMEL